MHDWEAELKKVNNIPKVGKLGMICVQLFRERNEVYLYEKQW